MGKTQCCSITSSKTSGASKLSPSKSFGKNFFAENLLSQHWLELSFLGEIGDDLLISKILNLEILSLENFFVTKFWITFQKKVFRGCLDGSKPSHLRIFDAERFLTFWITLGGRKFDLSHSRCIKIFFSENNLPIKFFQSFSKINNPPQGVCLSLSIVDFFKIQREREN